MEDVTLIKISVDNYMSCFAYKNTEVLKSLDTSLMAQIIGVIETLKVQCTDIHVKNISEKK